MQDLWLFVTGKGSFPYGQILTNSQKEVPDNSIANELWFESRIYMSVGAF